MHANVRFRCNERRGFPRLEVSEFPVTKISGGGFVAAILDCQIQTTVYCPGAQGHAIATWTTAKPTCMWASTTSQIGGGAKNGAATTSPATVRSCFTDVLGCAGAAAAAPTSQAMVGIACNSTNQPSEDVSRHQPHSFQLTYIRI